MIFSLIFSLILTITVEIFTAFLLGMRKKRDFLMVLLVNIVTNPIVVYTGNVLLILGVKTWEYGALALLETAAVLAEAMIFHRELELQRNPFVFSLLLNAASFLTGEGITILMRWILS